MHVHQIQSVGKFAKKSCHNWMTLERIYWFFIAIPREPLKLRQHVRHCEQGFLTTHPLLSQRRICDVGQGKKQSCCKTVVLLNDLWRENKTRQKIRSAYKIQPYLKLLKNVGKKTSTCFFGVQKEKAFLSFFVFEGPYHQFHITKKSATSRTCWH